MFPVTDHLLFVQGQEGEDIAEETKKSNHVQRKLEKRR
jgi:small subunit ribosomal protein S8e